MENLAQTVISVGSGDIGSAHLAVMARTAEADEPRTRALNRCDTILPTSPRENLAQGLLFAGCVIAGGRSLSP
jgi:hypothetical protein